MSRDSIYVCVERDSGRVIKRGYPKEVFERANQLEPGMAIIYHLMRWDESVLMDVYRRRSRDAQPGSVHSVFFEGKEVSYVPRSHPTYSEWESSPFEGIRSLILKTSVIDVMHNTFKD